MKDYQKQFVVYYPIGRSTVRGVERDNADIAKEMVEALLAGKSITLALAQSELENRHWKVGSVAPDGTITTI